MFTHNTFLIFLICSVHRFRSHVSCFRQQKKGIAQRHSYPYRYQNIAILSENVGIKINDSVPDGVLECQERTRRMRFYGTRTQVIRPPPHFATPPDTKSYRIFFDYTDKLEKFWNPSVTFFLIYFCVRQNYLHNHSLNPPSVLKFKNPIVSFERPLLRVNSKHFKRPYSILTCVYSPDWRGSFHTAESNKPKGVKPSNRLKGFDTCFCT